MSLENCPACGGEMRLGGSTFRVNRKRGVAHYIAHMKMTGCRAADGFECAAMKPYPPREADKEWNKLIARWNAAAIEARADPALMKAAEVQS